MTDHPYQLYAVEFTEADQPRLAGFACGDEVWSRHAAEWIQGSDVFDSIRKGTKVWLFENADGEIVGFGSVGRARWRWPPPDGAHAAILLIPMLGLDTRFQGQPADSDWRYAKQVLSHLLSAASEMVHEAKRTTNATVDWLVLTVHRENRRAVRFYEKCGFVLIPDVVRRQDHLVMKLWLGNRES